MGLHNGMFRNVENDEVKVKKHWNNLLTELFINIDNSSSSAYFVISGLDYGGESCTVMGKCSVSVQFIIRGYILENLLTKYSKLVGFVSEL